VRLTHSNKKLFTYLLTVQSESHVCSSNLKFYSLTILTDSDVFQIPIVNASLQFELEYSDAVTTDKSRQSQECKTHACRHWFCLL